MTLKEKIYRNIAKFTKQNVQCIICDRWYTKNTQIDKEMPELRHFMCFTCEVTMENLQQNIDWMFSNSPPRGNTGGL